MLTQCPGCQTVFRITGAILRAAHGQVRCGRCNTQFDAVQNTFEHEELIEDSIPAEQREAEKTEFMPSHQATSDATEFMSSFDHDTQQQEQITMEGDDHSDDHSDDNSDSADDAMQKELEAMAESDTTDDSIIEIFSIDSEEWHSPFPAADASVRATATPSPHPEELTRVRQQFFGELDEQPRFDAGTNVGNVSDASDNIDAFNESIYMTGDSHAATHHVDELLDNEAARSRTVFDEDIFGAESAAEPESVFEPDPPSILEQTKLRRWATSRAHAKEKEPPPDVLEPDQYVEPEVANRWPLLLACAGMSALLAIQVVHHYRQTLVRHPGFGATLKSIYSVLGQHLEPRWEVNAYSIKQWGIVSDPQEPGVLRVRASVTNNANFAQPYPLLKLTLEDRFGTRLGMRAFKPVEYLPSTPSATRLLEAGVAANVDLAIVDPGEEAVGFQFDSCLGDEHALRCAHD